MFDMLNFKDSNCSYYYFMVMGITILCKIKYK